MAEWLGCSIGDLCDTISDTYKGNDDRVVLINTSDVLEGKILNKTPVDNKNLKGQFKKLSRKMISFILKSDLPTKDLHLLT